MLVPSWKHSSFRIKNSKGTEPKTVGIGMKKSHCRITRINTGATPYFCTLVLKLVNAEHLKHSKIHLSLFQSVNYILMEQNQEKRRVKKGNEDNLKPTGMSTSASCCLQLQRCSECNHRYLMSSFQFLTSFFFCPILSCSPAEKGILGSIVSIQLNQHSKKLLHAYIQWNITQP